MEIKLISLLTNFASNHSFMKQQYLIILALLIVPWGMISAQEETMDTTISLKMVEILGQAMPEQAFTVTSMDRKEIDALPARDVGGLLRNIPNVSGIRKSGAVSDPVVRGFKYSQLNVQLNGGQKIEGGCPNRMDPATAHIDADDIRSLEVIKGPFALRYGPNFGGVVNINTLRPLPNKKFRIRVGAMMGYESNWNGKKQRLSLQGGNRNVFFSLSGNMKDYGNYSDGDGREVSSSFKKYNYTAQLGISPFRDQYLILSYDQSFGRDVMFPSLPMDEREDDTRLISLDYKAVNIAPVFKEFTAKLYLSDVSHLMDNKQRPFSDTVVAVSDITARNYGYRFEGKFSPGENELIIGTDFEHISKDGTRTKTKILEPTMPVFVEDLWNDALILNNGLFLLYRREMGRFTLDAAARIDMNRASSAEMRLEKMGNEIYRNQKTESDFLNFSASLGGIYSISKSVSLRMSLGRGVRSPDMNERFIMFLPIGYDNYDYLGNPELKPEANHEADLSVVLDLENAGSIEAGYFFSYVTNYITAELLPESEAKSQTAGVYGVKQFYNEDYVYLRGFEISYRSPDTYRWIAGVRMACTRGINPEARAYIIENGEVTGEKTIKNDPLPEIPPLEGSLDLGYAFFKKKLVPVFNLRMVAAQKNISEAYMEDETPGFMLLNFNLSWRFNDMLKFTGGISNILDKTYYEHLNRRIIGGRGNLYEPGRVFYMNIHFNI